MTVVFMVSTKGELLSLDSTVNVSKNRSNSLTKSSVMTGAQISDGYIIGNPSVTFSGICSYTKINRGRSEGNSPPDPDKFNVILDEMVLSQERFTLYGNDLIPSLDDVVILDYSINQGVFENAIEITITVEQVFVSESAQKTRVTVPSANTNGDVTEEQDLGQGNKTQQEESRTLLRTLADSAGGLF